MGPQSKHWPQNWYLICSYFLNTGKKIVLQDFVKSFDMKLNAPLSTLKGGCHMGPSKGWWDSKEFSAATTILLNIRDETKIKINRKPCQILEEILEDPRAKLSSLSHTPSEPIGRIMGKLAKASKGREFFLMSVLLISIVPGRERKVKFHIVLSFPNPDSCWVWFWSAYWLPILSLPGTVIAFLFVLFCVLRTWCGFLPAWTHRLPVLVYAVSSTISLGTQRYNQMKMGWTLLAARYGQQKCRLYSIWD